MRKLYGFLLSLFVLSMAVGQSNAQTYNMTDYLVRPTTGSGSTWSEIQGQHITNLEQATYYYNISGPIQVPFNFRFLNQQITTSNTFEVNGCGSVIFSPTWVTGTGNYPDYYSYYGYGYEYDYGSYASGYSYPYDFINSEQDGGSYGYFPNYKIAPFDHYCYDFSNHGDFQWTVIGSAPNRQLVVQTKNLPGYYYYSPNIRGSWQAVVYENGISNFQMNYGPETGTFGSSGGTQYGWDIGYRYNYGSYSYEYDYSATGIKAQGGQNLMLGWFGTASNTNDHTYAANTAGTGIYPKWSYNVTGYSSAQYTLNASGQRISDYTGFYTNNGNKHLPTTSYRIFIAWDYDMSADRILNPADGSIKLRNASITPSVQISNQGKSVPTSVTVRMIIRRTTDSIAATPGNPAVPFSAVYSQDVVLTGAQIPAIFSSTTVTFPTFTPTVYDVYRDTVYVLGLQPTADQANSDNMTWSEFTVSPPNNIKAIAVTNPAAGTRTPINVATPVGARFMNAGANDQTNVPVTMVIRDPSGSVVFRDTVIIPNWPSGKKYDTTFKDWTPAVNGIHTLQAIAIMGTDELRLDDTTTSTIAVRYESDVAAISVVNPQADEEKPFGRRWQPGGIFQSVGVADLFDVQARVQIKRCSDGALVFQADSNIPELNVDQNYVRFYFPSKQGNYDVTKLAPGCYTQCVIAKYTTDGDRTNDTACSTFSVISRLHGDIYVGVGQRFQSIHASVDSMRFRGVDGNLRLILTDANYTENGQTTSSSPNGALDFGGIVGVSDQATVTYMPKAGVTPRIVFTGNSPNLFYFGNLSPSYFTFDGYNPVGVKTPDKLVAEPTKRGMMIVDSTTRAGAMFAFEWSSHHMNLKNLRLIGNGLFTSDSSAGVRLFMEPTQQSYLQNIKDTIALNHISVDNCEIGNVRYGITDHGSRTQFNLGQSRFMNWRNHDNAFTRNTIGSMQYPIGQSGVKVQNEENTTIAHNEISNVNGTLSGVTTAYGIQQGTYAQADTGNVVGLWIDANRIHNVSATGTVYGVSLNQASIIYTVGTGINAVKSGLPSVTMNRTTNNMIYDLRGASTVYPISYRTTSNGYNTDRDSVFNNSISTSNATVNVSMTQQLHPFVWNNILQNTGTGSYTNYYFQVTRPFVPTLSSDYNLYDLRGSGYTFATVAEYDGRTSTLIQTRNFRRLNDWVTFTGQDKHSVVGNPMFSTDSLHLPGALSYVASPASNNGAWLGSSSERRDFDGDQRLMGNQTPDIGADEFEGFQYTNDLAVVSILSPAGITTSMTDTTTVVTMENPWYITASIKNQSSQAVFNRTVTATLQRSTDNGATWTQIWTQTTSPMNYDVNETKSVTFTGPALPAPTATTLYRVTVSVPTDQYVANNSQTKTFRVILKTQAIVVSYTSATPQGIRNRDSVTAALRRLGFDGVGGHAGYDSLDRAAYGSNDIDYGPWWTVVWSTGNAAQALNATNSNVGEGALSFKETEELTRYLQQGRSYAKKSVIVAGQNVAYYNGFSMVNNVITDSNFVQTLMHTRYVANSPVSGAYAGAIRGMQPLYWTYGDNLNSLSPDVIKPSVVTPVVGPEVSGYAYAYMTHPQTPSDSGAGTTYTAPTMNTVFFGFDWADGVQTTPGEAGGLTSGTTRNLRGALDFLQSHAGTVLPVEFTSVNAKQIGGANGSNALITWQTANQTDVARFEVELKSANGWSKVGTTAADQYAYTYAGITAGTHYTFRVVAIDRNGTRTESGSVELTPATEAAFTLSQNYPNPFNPSTVVSYRLGTNAQVTLRLLDVTGKDVKTVIANEPMTAGEHSQTIVADDLASGTYVYELVAVQPNGQTVTLTRKMTLNK